MTTRRWFGLAAATGLLGAVVSASAIGLAATHAASHPAAHAPHSNYKGTSRPAAAAKVANQSNYRGTARPAHPAAATVNGSNKHH